MPLNLNKVSWQDQHGNCAGRATVAATETEQSFLAGVQRNPASPVVARIV